MSIKLYIGSELADFNEAFNVMFSIGDIRNLSFGNANKSYTLNLPLTRTNKRLLKFINQPDVKSEPSTKGRLYLNDLLVIGGSVQVTSVSDYHASVLINSDDWIDALKDKKLTELDLSVYDHTFTKANVENSWTASYPFYRYPMIDFGGLASAETGATAKWYPNDFIPMFSVKNIIEKILSPYTVSSSWLTSNFVKDLYILANEKINEDFIKAKALLCSAFADGDNNNTVTISGGGSGNASISDTLAVFNTLTTDEAGGMNPGRTEYTIPATGTYKFFTSVKLRNTGVTAGFTINAESATIKIQKIVGAVVTDLVSSSLGPYAGTELLNNAVININTAWEHFTVGDKIAVNISILCGATNTTGGNLDLTVGLKAVDSIFYNTWGNVNKYSGINKNISAEEMLPDISQLDFLAAIRDIFHVRFWKDMMKNVIYSEPWQNFISSTVIDLTSYIDFESISNEFISSNYYKKIRLKWKDDTTDVAVTDYLRNNTVTPGYKDITLTSLYSKDGEEVREHPFSGLMTGYNWTIQEFTTPVPRIFKNEQIYPYFIFDRKTGFNIRLVEWKGMTSGFTWYYETTTKTTYPKIQQLDLATMYSTYQQKLWHYIDKGKLFTFRLKMSPSFLSQFFTVVNTATSEGFRPTYSIVINGIKHYFFMQKITTNGVVGEIEMVLKQ